MRERKEGLRRQRQGRQVIARALAVAVLGLALAGCGTAGVVAERVADRAVESAQWYCAQPRTARSILRVEANRALEGEASVVIACQGDQDGEYETLRTHYVDPLGDASVNRLLLRVIERGEYTLPDGRTLRVVVE